jgi:hypothetical protein
MAASLAKSRAARTGERPRTSAARRSSEIVEQPAQIDAARAQSRPAQRQPGGGHGCGQRLLEEPLEMWLPGGELRAQLGVEQGPRRRRAGHRATSSRPSRAMASRTVSMSLSPLCSTELATRTTLAARAGSCETSRASFCASTLGAAIRFRICRDSAGIDSGPGRCCWLWARISSASAASSGDCSGDGSGSCSLHTPARSPRSPPASALPAPAGRLRSRPAEAGPRAAAARRGGAICG